MQIQNIALTNVYIENLLKNYNVAIFYLHLKDECATQRSRSNIPAYCSVKIRQHNYGHLSLQHAFACSSILNRLCVPAMVKACMCVLEYCGNPLNILVSIPLVIVYSHLY